MTSKGYEINSFFIYFGMDRHYEKIAKITATSPSLPSLYLYCLSRLGGDSSENALKINSFFIYFGMDRHYEKIIKITATSPSLPSLYLYYLHRLGGDSSEKVLRNKKTSDQEVFRSNYFLIITLF